MRPDRYTGTPDIDESCKVVMVKVAEAFAKGDVEEPNLFGFRDKVLAAEGLRNCVEMEHDGKVTPEVQEAPMRTKKRSTASAAAATPACAAVVMKKVEMIENTTAASAAGKKKAKPKEKATAVSGATAKTAKTDEAATAGAARGQEQARQAPMRTGVAMTMADDDDLDSLW